MTSLPNRFPSFRVIIRCRFHSGFNIQGIFLENDPHTPMEKERKRKMNSKVTCVLEETEEVAKRHHESLASTLGHLILQEKSWSKESPSGNRRFNCWGKGVNKAVKVILSDQTFHAFMQSLAVPDWDFYIWQLSKQGIHWPVSPDRIAGSVMNPSRWSICLQLLVLKWTQAQVQFF